MKEIEYLKEEYISSYIEFVNDVFGYEPTVENIKKLIENEIVLVIMNDYKVIASITLEKKYEYIKGLNYYHVSYFGVLKQYRRMGYAKMLFNKVEELVKENDIKYLELTSGNQRTSAHYFYQANGFRIKDTSVFIKFY